MAFAPIKSNGAFFVFMYALGMVCTHAVVPNHKWAHAYELAPYELFFDVYALCVLLALLPAGIRLWVRRVFYTVAYLLAVIDVYCFVKFDSTITPTMLLLVGETDSREAGEFLASYLSLDIIFSRVGWVLSVMLLHLACAEATRLCGRRLAGQFGRRRHARVAETVLGAAAAALLVWSTVMCWDNKRAFARLMSYDKIGDVEHELTEKTRATLYQPVYRLVFSVYANGLTSRQVTKLVAGIGSVAVDSCTFRSPNIVLIIGESYNRHHAQLYGYDKETTPRQVARAERGELVPYSDVVAPWNLTSFVFKHLFSLYAAGDSGEWCDYPLFPELFRKAGYHVTFLTNQFLPQAKEAVYDFSGGFFLNNPELSRAMFDTRNERLYYFDEGLLHDYDNLKEENRENNLVIFHLKGQHVDYRTRCPKSKMKYGKEDYDRPELNARERQVLAYYDNAILYNDSIVDQIIQRFEDEDAIVVYVPDHGEECYGGGLHFYGRMHSVGIDARMAHEEFEIPFWIYCSPKYRERHPDVFRAVRECRDRPYMTDALPHLLLYLAGIHSKDYRGSLNVLSPDYDAERKRMLKHETDYDGLNLNKKNEDLHKPI